MALATKCPHCNTIFRVAADQLKLRGGIVRCGACHQVFDGNAALVEPAAKPVPVIPDVAAEVAAAPLAAEPAVSSYVHGQPVDFELDLDDEAAMGVSASAPAVWRTSAAAGPGGDLAPEDAPMRDAASPDDIARAAVARAFAAVSPLAAASAQDASSPLAAAPQPGAGSPSDAASLADAASPDAASPLAAGPTPATAPLPTEAPEPVDAPPFPAMPADAAPPDSTLLPAAEPDSFATPKAADALPPESEEQPRPWEDMPAEARSLPDDASQAEAASELSEDLPAPAEAAPPADSEAGDEQPDEPPAVENIHPDGRIEPSLDTPQEHIIAAALDDAHHFEDLPSSEQLAADEAKAGAGEPALGDASWSAAGGIAVQPMPAGDEPWSLSEPEPERDETALHAVVAVNTDAPDDGESVPEDEQSRAEPATSRRERALKRAKARRDASGPAQLPTEGAPAAAGADEAGSSATQEDPAQAGADAPMHALAGVGEAAEDLDHSDLSFVKRVDRSQKYGKAIKLTMAFGIPLLLAGLVLQAATTFRDTLAANYPQLKPTLAAICQPLGCKVALPAQLDALSIEQGELVTMAGDTFSFSTVLRNQSRIPQAWPHIELTLNDNADKPVLRRVFAPREYLPSPADAEKGFGPRSEQSVKLYFELKDLKASGYHIAIFYP